MLNSKTDHTPISPTASACGTTTTIGVTPKSSSTQVTATASSTKQNKSHGEDDESDIIGDLMGKYGKWQLIMTLLLSLFQVPNTFHIISPVYQVCIYVYL